MKLTAANLSMFVTDAVNLQWVGKTVELYEVLHQHESILGELHGPMLPETDDHPAVEIVRVATGEVEFMDTHHIQIEGERYRVIDNALIKIVVGLEHQRWNNGWRKLARFEHAPAKATAYI